MASAIRGVTLGGGAAPSLTQPVKPRSSARSVQACGLGFGCCWQLPNGGAVYNGIEGILGECGGGLSCATCHCYVDDAWAAQVGTPTSQDERDLLEGVAAQRKATSRLSCQITVTEALDGLVVHLPEAQY